MAIAQAGLSYGQTNQQENPTTQETISSQPSKKQIYLTIDDGPGVAMPDMLSILGNNNPVVFYIIGKNMETGTRIRQARQAIEQGHIIGNHSYSHPEFSRISIDKGKSEIEKTDKIIEQVYNEVGILCPKKLFRFPYGDPGYWYSEKTGVHGTKAKKQAFADFLKEQGYTTQYWDVDTDDWRYYSEKTPRSLPTILSNAMSANDGDIVLMHDRPKTSVAIINNYLNSKKFEFILP